MRNASVRSAGGAWAALWRGGAVVGVLLSLLLLRNLLIGCAAR